ncbi:assimilatory nitrate reductase NasA [Haloferacaceae archaeon DSL9]
MTEPIPTTCMRCAVGCGHIHHGAERGYGLDQVRGNPTHPVNRGLACGRGIRETSDPGGDWLTRPLVRKDGKLVRATWDDALERAAAAIREATSVDLDSVAVLGSGQQTNEAAYALGKLARGGIGTRQYDANTTLCMASAVAAYYGAFGSDAPPPTYDDIPEADAHVIWGANPAVAHPVMFRWIADAADDGALLVVDPVETKTAAVADEHVALAPGGDLALARGVLASLLDQGLVDRDFVDAHTDGFVRAVDGLPSVEEAAAAAGVEPAAITRLAAAFGQRTLVYWGMGVNQSVRGTATAGALIDLCLASGNLGPGSGPFSLTGQANSMGTRVCSSKGTWPGHRPFDDPEEREFVANAWGVPTARLPTDSGPGPVGIFEAAPDVIWTVATNPAAGMPNAGDVREQLAESFLIAQDAFRTETVEYADVVLPAATWGESSGTAMNMERTISRVRPATDLPSGVRTDLRLVAEIGARVAPELFPTPRPDPEAVFDEFRALTAGTDADCSGVSYGRLDAEHAVRWPAPDADTRGGYRYYWPNAPAGERWSFPTASGSARFSTAQEQSLPEPPTDEYPLTLTTARRSDGYNTGVRSRSTSDESRPLARLNPETAARFAAAIDGEETTIRSPRGAIAARIELDETIPSGLVWLPIHHPAVNRLTSPAVDRTSREPNLKQCAVRLAASGAAPATPAPIASGDRSE